MILWINGAFGSGKTTAAYELHRRLPNSFVYDPENAGYFIRRNTNRMFEKDDFQDIPLWREINYKMLRMVAEKCDGTVIVPMTLVNPDYYGEIIGALISDGIDIRHFILYANRDEIKRRIKKRSIPVIGKDEFALKAIDRCVHAFDNYITDIKIQTDNINVENVVDKIAVLAGLQLLPDKRTKLVKQICRAKILIKNIR